MPGLDLHFTVTADTKRTWAELDRLALVHNLERVRESSDTPIMAVIKSDAYGHGMQFVAKVLVSKVDSFAVATLEEAMVLRAQCPQIPITLLSGFYQPGQIELFSLHRIRPVIFNFFQLEWLGEAAVVPEKVWLKIDTGMGRLGVEPGRVEEAVKDLQSMGCEVGMMSHFSSADMPEAEQNEAQHHHFVQATRAYPLLKSFANSAAILSRPQDHFDLLRPGIMLYGSSPFADRTANDLGLRPVMSLYARLLDIKQLKAGDQVGYGAHWTANRDCTIGVVSIGYGDGYPRVISEDAQVAIADKRHAIIGRVSMDSFAVLLEGEQRYAVGAQVELWGHTISVDEVAAWANTIGYELLCKVTQRVVRVEI